MRGNVGRCNYAELCGIHGEGGSGPRNFPRVRKIYGRKREDICGNDAENVGGKLENAGKRDFAKMRANTGRKCGPHDPPTHTKQVNHITKAKLQCQCIRAEAKCSASLGILFGCVF